MILEAIYKFSRNGWVGKNHFSKRTAGEQRVNISWERVGVGYNLAGAGLKKQFRADLYSKDSHAENEWKVDQSKIIIMKSINNVRSLRFIR